MTLYKMDERYANDPAFHAMVDVLQKVMMDLQLLPSEVRDAAVYAAYLVEMRRPFADRHGVRLAAEDALRRGTR